MKRILRSALAVLAGVATLVVLVVAAMAAIHAGWPESFGPGRFPATWIGQASLLTVEVVAGAAAAFVAAVLAPGARRAHGWVVGALVLALDILTVVDPESPWHLVPAVLLVILVPFQTFAGIALALRVRKGKELR